MPSICTTRRSSPERSVAIQFFIRSVDNATKWREVADFDTPAPAGAGTSPSGSRTARPNFRVETLMSMRFIAHRPSQSSATACSQHGSAISWPPSRRTRGRSTSTMPPWKPIFPCVRPQRCPCRPSLRACRGPHSSSASFSIIAPRASMPAVKQKRSKLADTLSQAFPRASTFVGGKTVSVVLILFMALLSFRGISTPSLPAQGEQRRFSLLAFQHLSGHPLVFRRDSYNEHNTTRGGARFQCGSVIVATSLHAVDPAVDPNHDADIRIGSEAPKRRLPNRFPGMKAMGGLRATATSDRSWHRRLQAPGSPKLGFSFSPIACPVLLLLMPLTLTGSLRALNLCSHSARARRSIFARMPQSSACVTPERLQYAS